MLLCCVVVHMFVMYLVTHMKMTKVGLGMVVTLLRETKASQSEDAKSDAEFRTSMAHRPTEMPRGTKYFSRITSGA